MTGELDWLPGGANSESERGANADEACANAGRVGVLLCLVQDPQRAGTGATGAGSWEAVVVVGLVSPDTPGEYRDTPDYHLLAEVQTREAVVGCGIIIQSELRQITAEASFTSELNLDRVAKPRRTGMMAGYERHILCP